MNRLPGVVSQIDTSGNLSLLHIRSGDQALRVLLIDHPSRNPLLREGSQVNLLWKETEAIVSRQPTTDLSIVNQLAATVQRIEKGALLSRVYVDLRGYSIQILLLTDALNAMAIQPDDDVWVFIQCNEIMIQAYDKLDSTTDHT